MWVMITGGTGFIGSNLVRRLVREGNEVVAYDVAPTVSRIADMRSRVRDIVIKKFKGGECFVRFFKKSRDAKIAKYPVIRVLNYWEINKINRDPKDIETVISYVRSYRDNDHNLREETIPAEEIIHIKGGAKDDQRGLPDFQSILKHCVWYDDWVHNRVIYNRLKTSFYLEEIIPSSPGNTTTAEGQYPNQTQQYGKGGKEIQRMPKMGTKITHNAAVKYNWLKPDIRADDASEDGRVIRMAICTGGQFPEFILGDASQANYSSTMVSQNPFVRKIEYYQQMFEQFFKEIYAKIIQHGIDVKSLSGMSTKTETIEKASNIGIFRKIQYKLRANEEMNEKGDIVKKKKKIVPTNTEVDFIWPTIIKQNLKEETEAYQIHQNMGVVSTATLSQKLGYDWDEEQRKLDKEEPLDTDDPGDDDYDKKKKRDLDDTKKKKKDDDDE